MGGNKGYFYFCVHSLTNKDLPDEFEKTVMTRYFTSGFEVAKYLGVCRQSVFNGLNNGGKIITRPDYFSIFSKIFFTKFE